jgi:GH25 family lysozyme M1 (1,4-beta-N-acetylmuramidase)
MRPDVARRPHRTLAFGRVASSIVCALLLAGLVWLPQASAVLAGTPMAAACDGVRIRTGPSTGDPTAATVNAGTQVNVETTVSGGPWSATCAGNAVSGDDWYQISELNGQSVAALFGVPSVYSATGLFHPIATPTPTPTPDPFATPTPTPTPDPFATPTPTPTPDPFATPTPSPTPSPTPFLPVTEGIDVSSLQGRIDWTAVAVAGKRFAYIKASEGASFVDTSYAVNRIEARAAGLYVGAYHYARPDLNPNGAVTEADQFIDTAQPAAGELLPVLDLEKAGSLSATELQDWVRTFLDRIYERLGVRGVIYVSPNFWKASMGDTTWFAAAGYRVIWVAHWTSAGAPSVPGDNWAGSGWTFWQYTSSGAVPGISGRIDLDRYGGTDFTPVLIGGGPAQPSPQDPSLSIASTLPATTYREPVTLIVGMQPLGAGRAVELQRLSPVDADWATIASVTTDATGLAASSYGPPYNTQFWAVWPGSADLSPATSAPVQVLVRHFVRFPAGGTTRTVGRGTRLNYTAMVRPLAPSGSQRVSFLIYRRVGGMWTFRTSATLPVNAAGQATFSWRWGPGEWYVRARVNATIYNTAALSPIARVRVP